MKYEPDDFLLSGLSENRKSEREIHEKLAKENAKKKGEE